MSEHVETLEQWIENGHGSAWCPEKVKTAIRAVLEENKRLRAEVAGARREWDNEIRFHQATTARIDAALTEIKVIKAKMREQKPLKTIEQGNVFLAMVLIEKALQGEKP